MTKCPTKILFSIFCLFMSLHTIQVKIDDAIKLSIYMGNPVKRRFPYVFASEMVTLSWINPTSANHINFLLIRSFFVLYSGRCSRVHLLSFVSILQIQYLKLLANRRVVVRMLINIIISFVLVRLVPTIFCPTG